MKNEIFEEAYKEISDMEIQESKIHERDRNNMETSTRYWKYRKVKELTN